MSNLWSDRHNCYETLEEPIQNLTSKESKLYEISKVNFCKENKFSLFYNFVQKNRKPFCFVLKYANPSEKEMFVEGNEIHLGKKINEFSNYPFSKHWWISDLLKRNNNDDCASNMFDSCMIDYIWIKEIVRNNTNWNECLGVHPEDCILEVIYKLNRKSKMGVYLECSIYVLEKEIRNKNNSNDFQKK